MNPNTYYNQTQKNFARLEDSFSLPENQKHLPEDPYVETVEKRLIKKWHTMNRKRRKMACLSSYAVNI